MLGFQQVLNNQTIGYLELGSKDIDNKTIRMLILSTDRKIFCYIFNILPNIKTQTKKNLTGG